MSKSILNLDHFLRLREQDPAAPVLVQLSQTEPWFHFVDRPDLHEAIGAHPNRLTVYFDGKFQDCVIPMTRAEDDLRPALAIIFSIADRPREEKYVLVTSSVRSQVDIETTLDMEVVRGVLYPNKSFHLDVERAEFRYMSSKSGNEGLGHSYRPKLNRA